MRTGRREIETGKRKLNIFKVFIVLLLIVLVIVVVYFSFNKDNKDTTNEEYNKKIDEALVEDIQEEKSKTIDDIVSEFGGEIKEQVKNDTYYITKDGKDYTAYLDGEVVEGKIVPWNGTAVQPSIDEAGNINIYTAEELKWLADQVITGQKNFSGVTITLRKNIDLGARKNEEDKWEGAQWTPIIGFLDELPKQKTDKQNSVSTNTVTENPADVQVIDETVDITKENLKRFAGIFNGNELSIRGLYIDSDKRYQGLFGYQTGIIQNLTVKNSNIKGGIGTGTIVGLNGGKIVNCTIQNVEVKGAEKIGGFAGIGMTSSWMENCIVSDDTSIVYGEKYTGGIVGYMNNNAAIVNCVNRANITGKEYIGGIVGISFYGTIIKSSSNFAMNVVGDNYVGGLVGYSQSQIENSYNHNNENKKGIVSGKNYIGGLVGLNYLMGNVTDSYNSGEIKAEEDNCGGIVGLNNATISSCYNTGNINVGDNAGGKVGGICGQNVSDSFIYSSYNIGKVQSKNSVGGVVGADFGTISNCFCLDSSITNPSGEIFRPESEMKTGVISNLGETYKEDTENINSGYPILSWQ